MTASEVWATFWRRPYLTLALWTLVVATGWLVAPPASSWHFFHDSAGMLLHTGRLDLWRDHPEFQFGPTTVATSAALRLVAGSHDVWLARVAMFPLAPLIVWLADDASRSVRPSGERSAERVLLAGIVLVPIWDYVALGSLHIDDAIALTATVVAVWAVATNRGAAAAVAVGLAANAKPWAIVFLPLLLALPPDQRRRGLLVAMGVAVLPWAPFVVSGHGTFAALRGFRIHNAPTSALRALGVHDRYTPRWVRPAQLLGGMAGGLWAARRRLWFGVVLVGVAIRLLLDPGAHLYYTAGLVVAALIWDLFTSTRLVPWLTILSALALQTPRVLSAPHALSGWLRVAITVAALLVVAFRRVGASALTTDEPRPTHPAAA